MKPDVYITGMPIIWAKDLNDMRDGMTTITLCIASSALLLSFVFLMVHKEKIPGVLAVIPLMYVIGWLFLSMKFFQTPLNMMTALVGAIGVGMGIVEELSKGDLPPAKNRNRYWTRSSRW